MRYLHSTRRWGLLTFACVLLALCAIASGRPALADQPVMLTIPVNDTYISSTECGFAVIVHDEGTIRITVHRNNGRLGATATDHFNMSGSYTNPANNVTLNYNEAANITLERNADDSYNLIFRGSLYNVHGQGLGSATLFAGRIILHEIPGSYDYAVIFQAGRTSGDPIGPLPTICPFLQ